MFHRELHCVKLHWGGRAACFLYSLSTPLSYNFADMMIYCSSSRTVALQTNHCKCTFNYILCYQCTFWGSPNKDSKRQINKHLLVFRLICSLLNPVVSHDALHSVPGVCVFCVAWRGFLSPPGLQLTPLLIDVCPFSISIGKKLLLRQKQKPSAGGNVSVSFQAARSSIQLEDGSF